MTQKDLLERAAECARATDAISDPTQRKMFANLQTLWINLANESPFVGNQLAEQIAKVEQIHADLMRANFRDTNRDR